jgi:hypothetical protein
MVLSLIAFYRVPSRQCRQQQLACQRFDWRYACTCVPTDRNEEATGAFTAPEEVSREQLQPCIVAVEYYFFILPILAAATELGKPSILCSERGRGVALGEIEDEIEEGWHGAGGESLDTRHCNCRRSSVGGEGDSRAVSDQTAPKSVSIRRTVPDRHTSARNPSRCPLQRQNRSSAHRQP